MASTKGKNISLFGKSVHVSEISDKVILLKSDGTENTSKWSNIPAAIAYDISSGDLETIKMLAFSLKLYLENSSNHADSRNYPTLTLSLLKDLPTFEYGGKEISITPELLKDQQNLKDAFKNFNIDSNNFILEENGVRTKLDLVNEGALYHLKISTLADQRKFRDGVDMLSPSVMLWLRDTHLNIPTEFTPEIGELLSGSHISGDKFTTDNGEIIDPGPPPENPGLN